MCDAGCIKQPVGINATSRTTSNTGTCRLQRKSIQLSRQDVSEWHVHYFCWLASQQPAAQPATCTSKDHTERVVVPRCIYAILQNRLLAVLCVAATTRCSTIAVPRTVWSSVAWEPIPKFHGSDIYFMAHRHRHLGITKQQRKKNGTANSTRLRHIP